MTEFNRRDAFGLALAGGAALIPGAPAQAAIADKGCVRPFDASWRRGFEGQRIADLGDGRFLNPLIGGDRPDPARRARGLLAWFGDRRVEQRQAVKEKQDRCRSFKDCSDLPAGKLDRLVCHQRQGDHRRIPLLSELLHLGGLEADRHGNEVARHV